MAASFIYLGIQFQSAMKKVRVLLPAAVIILAAVLGFYSWSGNTTMSTNACGVQSTSAESQYLTNGGFEQGIQGWRNPLGSNSTAVLASGDPHCGAYSLEFVTQQSVNSTEVALS
jgi:hypothetical protein